MTFRIALCIHNQGCMLTILVSPDIERYVNIDLDRIRIWLAANKLTLNMTKTEFLLIGSRQRLSTLKIKRIP